VFIVKMVAKRLKEMELGKQTIKMNRISEMNTIKQTPERKNSSIIMSIPFTE